MNDLIVIGRVSTVYKNKNTVKVYREDKNAVTGELSIVYRNELWYPSVGDYVLCVFLPNSNISKVGFCIGKF